MRRQKHTEFDYFASQYFDFDSMPKEDLQLTRMELRIPKYLKDELRRFYPRYFDSMSECVQNALVRLFAGFDYHYATMKETEAAITERVRSYTAALVNTVRDLTENLEQYAAPLRDAARSTKEYTESIRENALAELTAQLEERKQLVKINVMRILHFYPSMDISEIVSHGRYYGKCCKTHQSTAAYG